MRTAIRVLLIVATCAVSAQEQVRPNFSGAWVVVPSRSIWFDDGRPVNITVFGERFTAEQTERVLSIAIENERGFKWIYRLDGVASHNAPPGPSGPQETSSTTVWADSTLIITTIGSVTREGRPEQVETRRRLTFNEDGTLRVEAPWGRDGAMIGSVYSRRR
jgi:hypothetical protein